MVQALPSLQSWSAALASARPQQNGCVERTQRPFSQRSFEHALVSAQSASMLQQSVIFRFSHWPVAMLHRSAVQALSSTHWLSDTQQPGLRACWQTLEVQVSVVQPSLSSHSAEPPSLLPESPASAPAVPPLQQPEIGAKPQLLLTHAGRVQGSVSSGQVASEVQQAATGA